MNTFIPLVLKNAGLKEGDVGLINVADGAFLSCLQGVGGTVGMLGGLDGKSAEIRASGGAPPVTFAYSSNRVTQVSYCIVAAKDTVATSPDLVRRFVSDTIRSYKVAEAEPQGARVTGPRIGIMFQDSTLVPWRTVEGNIALQLEMRGLDPTTHSGRIQHLMRAVRLYDFAARYLHKLSGGMQQRAAFCQALVHEPPRPSSTSHWAGSAR